MLFLKHYMHKRHLRKVSSKRAETAPQVPCRGEILGQNSLMPSHKCKWENGRALNGHEKCMKCRNGNAACEEQRQDEAFVEFRLKLMRAFCTNRIISLQSLASGHASSGSGKNHEMCHISAGATVSYTAGKFSVHSCKILQNPVAISTPFSS